MAIEHHLVGDFGPYVYKTEDYGQSWTAVTGGIADSPLSYVRHIEEDPVRPGLLYLGTENALYVSWDDGASWQSLMTDLPAAPVYGIAVQGHFNDLVIGTYGRGFWILDDLSPLQQLDEAMVVSVRSGSPGGPSGHLFDPRQAYRFQGITSPMPAFADPTVGENPSYGASLNYWLGEAPEGAVTLRIANAAGDTVRTLQGTTRTGLNRVWWDLRGEQAEPLRMRTRPSFADWFELGPERVRQIQSGGAILQPPGTYTVTLEVGDTSQSTSLEVIKDPHSEGSEADIATQVALLESIRADLEQTTSMINRIEWVRRQLQDLRAVLADSGDAETLVTAADELEGTLVALEEGLYQLRVTGTGQDRVRWPIRVFGRLQYLMGSVGTADFPPIDQAREVHAILQGRLGDLAARLESVIDDDVEAFNRLLRERGVGPVITDVRD